MSLNDWVQVGILLATAATAYAALRALGPIGEPKIYVDLLTRGGPTISLYVRNHEPVMLALQTISLQTSGKIGANWITDEYGSQNLLPPEGRALQIDRTIEAGKEIEVRLSYEPGDPPSQDLTLSLKLLILRPRVKPWTITIRRMASQANIKSTA